MTATERDPIALFHRWFEEAHHAGLSEPDAMMLATATRQGIPSARVVLLRQVDERGFVFFTNFTSRKGTELLENPHAALGFYWMPLKKQVRVEGTVMAVSADEADRYFAARPRGSQISAWASKQSAAMEHPGDFAERVKEITRRFEDQPVPRPPFWSGFRVVPERIEFWQEGEFRMHTRDIYTREGAGWSVGRYYP
jgi:pyridoxamine 5'-phosphate oxidase